ncbi:MAG TPA: DUF4397 domain-containing protein [Woeseiaceae bacterium]|nr:DUF4397 domain-containing protein [Woeseiaceae bacterium]
MTKNPPALVLLVCAGLLFAGCTETQREKATGEGSIRGIHAMASAPEVNFLIEERSLGKLSYRAVTAPQLFDDLVYDFNFDTRFPGDAEILRLATVSADIQPDTDYVFALTGTVDAPSIVVWETPERVFEEGETAFEASIGHLAAGSGDLDVYLAPPGTAPVAGQARGTLAFGELLPPFEAEAGKWVLTVTAAGDPAAVLFRSTTQSLAERSRVLFTIQDAGSSLTSELAVQRMTREGAAAPLADSRFPPTRRFFHAASGTAGLDVVVDKNFAAPIVSGLAFGQVSPDVEVPSGESTYSFTQAGNPGAILHEEEDSTAANSRSISFIAGAPADLELVTFPDDRRPIPRIAKLRATLLSANFEEADIYLLESGTDIADKAPGFNGIESLVSTGYLQLAPGRYDLTVTVAGEKTVAAGPLTLDLASGDIRDFAIIDTPDPNVLDIVGVAPP